MKAFAKKNSVVDCRKYDIAVDLWLHGFFPCHRAHGGGGVVYHTHTLPNMSPFYPNNTVILVNVPHECSQDLFWVGFEDPPPSFSFVVLQHGFNIVGQSWATPLSSFTGSGGSPDICRRLAFTSLQIYDILFFATTFAMSSDN